jgi:4-amino-4-deoxychorismate lyase
MAWVYLNGFFLSEEQACIPITDRGFLFGDGTFTTIRVAQGRVEFLQAHLERLTEQCQVLDIIPPEIKVSWIQELMNRNNAFEGVWRLKILVTGGQETALKLPVRSNGQLLITLKPYSMPPSTPCRLCLFPDPIHRPFSSIKSLAYLDRLAVNDYADKKGCDDAIVVSHEGFLLETAFSNVFGFDGKSIWIPDPQLAYVKGTLLKIIREYFPFPIQFFRETVQKLISHAVLYTCNAMTHIRPALEVEGKLIRHHIEFEEILKKSLEIQLGIFSVNLSA